VTTHAAVAVRRVADVLDTTPPSPDWMSPCEQQRAARLRAPARHAQYCAGHWLLRQLLARAFGGDPTDYPLIERENLPPAVAGSNLCVSLSHGGDWIAAAWSSAAIGVDIEARESRPALGRLQQLLLNPDEPLDSLDDDALLQRWVLKEAVIKRDHGIALPEQLAALQLQPTRGGRADVELLSSDDWHLAVTLAGILVDTEMTIRSSSRWVLCA